MKGLILYILVSAAVVVGGGATASAQQLADHLAAAKKGDAVAQYNAALCYLNGWGTEPNTTKARHFLRLSAEQSVPHAIERMATICPNEASALLHYWQHGLTDQQQGKIVYESYREGCYIGEHYAAMRDGVGIYLWDSGILYVGQWEFGERYGMGVTYFDGLAHYGSYNDTAEGFGAAIITNPHSHLYDCPDGVVYVGGWRDGEPEGRGTIYDASGTLIYYGKFHNGHPTDTYPSEESYTNYRWDTEQLANGDSYEGELLQGSREGFGIYRWADGSMWFGLWHKNLRHGDGILIMPTQDGLDIVGGTWESGQMQ